MSEAACSCCAWTLGGCLLNVSVRRVARNQVQFVRLPVCEGTAPLFEGVIEWHRYAPIVEVAFATASAVQRGFVLCSLCWSRARVDRSHSRLINQAYHSTWSFSPQRALSAAGPGCSNRIGPRIFVLSCNSTVSTSQAKNGTILASGKWPA